MHLYLIAVGERVPAWIAQGFEEYARRLRRPWTLKLKEIPAERRSRNADIAGLVRAKGELSIGCSAHRLVHGRA